MDLSNYLFLIMYLFKQSHAAQDSFLFIARKLIEDSNRLKGLHVKPETKNENNEKKKSKKEEESTHDLKLHKRDYFRCLSLNQNLRVSDAFIDHQAYKPTAFTVLRPYRAH